MVVEMLGKTRNTTPVQNDLAYAEIAYYRLDVGDAERYALQALFKAHAKDRFEVENKALFLLLRIYLHGGKFEKIQDVLQQIEQLTSRTVFPNRHTFREIEESWFYAVIGQEDRVASWIKSDIQAKYKGTLVDGFSDLAKCKHYLLTRNFNAMLAFIDSQINESGISPFPVGQIDLAINHAVCHYQLGNKREALRYLREAYELADPNALIMPFVEMGNNMRSLTNLALKTRDTGIPSLWLEMVRTKSSTYAKRVAYVRSRFLEEEHINGDVQLTRKELQLLEDLAQGLSRTEISLARGISVNTVKVMLQLIYEKLGAENGMDAVRIAATSKLL